jgi:hypothetical protein
MRIFARATITHDGPQDLKISLDRYFKEITHRRYYISKNLTPQGSWYPQYHYLHSDGILRPSTSNEDNQSTGWFNSLEEVEAAIEKYVNLQEQPSLSEVSTA